VTVVPGVLSVVADFREFANALAERFAVHTNGEAGDGAVRKTAITWWKRIATMCVRSKS
jgi:hypothetical protein